MCGDRPYSDWTGHWNGVLRKIPGSGTLFLEGYRPRVEDPNPWICPVRDCQTVFADAWALGGHFSAGHRACLLNDNLDGTMSAVGTRKTADPSSGRKPPVVVSRNAIDATTAAPKASPRRPGRRKKTETKGHGRASKGPGQENADDSVKKPGAVPGRSSSISHSRSSSSHLIDAPSLTESKTESCRSSRPLTPVSMSAPDAPGEQKLRKIALWQYLMMYLPHNTPLLTSSHALELLALPRQRDLTHRWKFQLAGGHPTAKTLCAVLVYLGGTKGHAPCVICAGMSRGSGFAAPILPFPECITLPASASAELKQYFAETACCNHFYQQSSADGGQTGEYCNSRFSVSSSDLGGIAADGIAEEEDEEEASPSQLPPPQDTDIEDEYDDIDTSTSTSIALSPATAHNVNNNSPPYKTALPATRVAGRPRIVSIRKAGSSRSRCSPTTTATTTTTTTTTIITTNMKPKRQSSIRRVAARLGGKGGKGASKAARREAAVYKPSESAVAEEAHHLAAADHTSRQGTTTTITESGSASGGGARRSRRLLEQQQQQQQYHDREQTPPRPEPESKQSGSVLLSRFLGVGTSSPSKSKASSKLREKENKDLNAGFDTVIGKAGREAGVEGVGLGCKPGGVPSTLLTMAEWELAPGRIRVGKGEEAENIAYSSSYLAQGRAVPVSEGTTFQVIDVQPGSSLRWAADESRIRLCSVARGIVRVKLPESGFPIGPNGMWKVRQGAACSLVNPFYLGAVVHVTAFEAAV